MIRERSADSDHSRKAVDCAVGNIDIVITGFGDLHGVHTILGLIFLTVELLDRAGKVIGQLNGDHIALFHREYNVDDSSRAVFYRARPAFRILVIHSLPAVCGLDLIRIGCVRHRAGQILYAIEIPLIRRIIGVGPAVFRQDLTLYRVVVLFCRLLRNAVHDLPQRLQKRRIFVPRAVVQFLADLAGLLQRDLVRDRGSAPDAFPQIPALQHDACRYDELLHQGLLFIQRRVERHLCFHKVRNNAAFGQRFRASIDIDLLLIRRHDRHGQIAAEHGSDQPQAC